MRVYSFANQEWSDYDANREGAMEAGGGHGGGDGGLMDAFTTAVVAGDPALVSTGAEASMASHRAVFAAAQRAFDDLGVTDVTLVGLAKRSMPGVELLALKSPDDLEAAHRMIREHGSSPTEGGTE